MLTKRQTMTPQAFWLTLLTASLIFLPFILYDGGYFIYYGDFNVQQIPFYKLAHEAVRSGDLFWSWYTDLGANFIGSYSFYLLFSPFFWLTLLFPTAWLPYLMAPLLVLKTACAALTAHLYLRRMVRDERCALIGSLLYTFSGWMAFNVFFNHFHDAAVFFPLLLLGLEKLVAENRHGLFAIAVLLNAMVNYWFFVGEAVFVVLYLILRATDRSWGLTVRKFAAVAFEAVFGFAAAAVFVLPSVMALLGNPRTGWEELLAGWDIWLYWHEQRQPAILQSLFFPPELPARPNFLPDHGAKWASLSGWLPLFAMTGVLAYFFRRKNDWLKKLLAVCLVFAMVPVLNSLFILLNDSYYARWFYMPVLLMALATARALEDSADSTADFIRGLKWSLPVVIVFAVASGLTPDFTEEGGLTFGLAADPPLMWIWTGIAVFCLAVTAVLILALRYRRLFFRFALFAVLVISFGFQVFYIANGKNNRERSQWLIDHAINGREQIVLPDDGQEFSRIDVYDSTDNLGMFWHRPTIQAFHSIVPPSIMEFYPEVGVTRDVGSRPETKYYALRPLLSVRWLFIEADNEEQEPMPGYRYFNTLNGFHIYENENFLPMGFTYDEYVTRDHLEDVPVDYRGNLMLRAVVLEEKDAVANSDILAPLSGERMEGFGQKSMAVDVENRRMDTADSFQRDNTGFTVSTSFDSPRVLFLSVPYEEGWSARIPGGEDLDIVKANVGFMAVRVPAGEQTVRFDYETPGLRVGLCISAGAAVVLIVYCLRLRCMQRKKTPPAPDLEALARGETLRLSLEQYRAVYGDKGQRARRLQQALNDAAAQQADNEILNVTGATQHIPAQGGETTGETDEQDEEWFDPDDPESFYL